MHCISAMVHFVSYMIHCFSAMIHCFSLIHFSYDALLGSGDSWVELCHRGMLHSGDNDSTGVIAGACYGAMYGFHGVPEPNYKVSPKPIWDFLSIIPKKELHKRQIPFSSMLQ